MTTKPIPKQDELPLTVTSPPLGVKANKIIKLRYKACSVEFRV